MGVVRQFTEPRAYAAAVTPFLERHEALNNILLRIAGRAVDKPEETKPGTYLAACFGSADSAAEIIGVAARTPPFNFVLSYPCPPAALAAFARDRLGSDLPGVIGPSHEAVAFAGVWRELCRAAGVSLRSNTTIKLRAYELTQVNEMPAVEGGLRTAIESDRALLTEWERAFFTELGGHAGAPSGASNPDGIFLWESNGEVVSQVRAQQGTPSGAVVNSVYTPPAHRRRGFAAAAVAAASRRMLHQGFRTCMLFTDLANPTSNAIYQRIGYRPAGDFEQIEFVR